MKNNYQFYAMITVLSWGIGNVFTRVALRSFSPFSIGFWRYAIASVILLALVLVKKVALPQKEDMLWFVLSGFTGFAFYMLTYNLGYVTITAATGSVISATIPLVTAALARLFFKEILTPWQWFAVILQFLGLFIIALPSGGFTVNEGVIWMLISALSLSIYNLIQHKMTEKYSAVQCSVYSIFCGSAMLAVFAPRAVHEFEAAKAESVFAIAFLGVFASAVAFLCWTKAFSLAKKTSQVSNYMFITPLISTGFEIILLGELPEVTTVIGGAVILVGAFLFGRVKVKLYQSKSQRGI